MKPNTTTIIQALRSLGITTTRTARLVGWKPQDVSRVTGEFYCRTIWPERTNKRAALRAARKLLAGVPISQLRHDRKADLATMTEWTTAAAIFKRFGIARQRLGEYRRDGLIQRRLVRRKPHYIPSWGLTANVWIAEYRAKGA